MISLAIAVGLAVALLVAVIWSGATRRRHLHYALVAGFFASLAAAVWRAELVGRGLIFEGTAATIHHVHDGVVALDLLLALALLVTGVRLARAPAPLEPLRRRFHRSLATLFAVSVLVSAALGTAMTMLARPVG
jgi:hypothetical protein